MIAFLERFMLALSVAAILMAVICMASYTLGNRTTFVGVGILLNYVNAFVGVQAYRAT